MNKDINYNDFFEHSPEEIDPIFKQVKYPWEYLNYREEFFKQFQEDLIESDVGNNIAIIGEGPLIIGKNVQIYDFSTIIRPAYIGDNVTIMSSALVRNGCWIGSDSTIGHAAEVARSFIFYNTNIAHKAMILDSVVGSGCNIAGLSGAANANSKFKKNKNIKIQDIDTGLEKLGFVLGDNVNFAPCMWAFPGTLIGKNTIVYTNESLFLKGVFINEKKIIINNLFS